MPVHLQSQISVYLPPTLKFVDVPMSSGIYNIRSKGNLLNCYEFEWDPQKESKLYVIVSTIMCVEIHVG